MIGRSRASPARSTPSIRNSARCWRLAAAIPLRRWTSPASSRPTMPASRTRSPGQAEVAVLGNSLLGGAGVGRDGQFTTLLARRLAGRKVLNLSLPGGGTEHQPRPTAATRRRCSRNSCWRSSGRSGKFRTGCTSSAGKAGVGPRLHSLSQDLQTDPRDRCAGRSVDGRENPQVVLPQLAQSYLLRAGYQGFVAVRPRTDAQAGHVPERRYDFPLGSRSGAPRPGNGPACRASASSSFDRWNSCALRSRPTAAASPWS